MALNQFLTVGMLIHYNHFHQDIKEVFPAGSPDMEHQYFASSKKTIAYIIVSGTKLSAEIMLLNTN